VVETKRVVYEVTVLEMVVKDVMTDAELVLDVTGTELVLVHPPEQLVMVDVFVV